MDSPVDKVVYNRRLQGVGATNSDEITEILDNLPIMIPVEKTSLIWNRVAQVQKLDPELIVIHFSAFQSKTVDCQIGSQQNECNARLKYFLRSLQGLKSKVLVYSRTRGFSSDKFKERFLKWLAVADPSFKERFTLFGMQDQNRNPQFGNPDTAMAFKETIVKLLGIDVTGKLPNKGVEPTH